MSEYLVAEKNALTRIAAPFVQSLGLDIWGIEITQTGRPIVRLFVEAPLSPEFLEDGALSQRAEKERPTEIQDAVRRFSASIDQCEEISRHLSLVLDVEDVFPQAYVLVVSTPGFQRLFFSPSQMKPYIGDMIEARMVSSFAPDGGDLARRIWRGVLTAVQETGIRLKPASVDSTGEILFETLPEVVLPWEMTRRVSRTYIFKQHTKPGKPMAGKSKKKADGTHTTKQKAEPRCNEALDGLDI